MKTRMTPAGSNASQEGREENQRQQQTEDAVRRNLAAIVEQSEDAIISGTPDGIITSWNRGAERIYGYTAEEIVGQSVAIIYPPDRLREFEMVCERTRRGERVQYYETIRRAKDGRDVPISLSVSPIRDEMGSIVAACVIARDITSRYQAQEALRRSEERYRSLVGAITSVVWQADASGAFAEPQASWEAYTGQSWEQHRGWGWVEAIHSEDRPRFMRAWESSLHSATAYEYEGRLWHAASQSYHHFEARGVPLHNPDGSVREWMGTATDIHARRCAEGDLQQLNARLEELVRERTAQLEAANKELEAFAYSVSHDLRAPLRAIDGFSLALVEEFQDQLDENGRRYVDRVRAATHRMGALIDAMIELSRVSRSQLELIPMDLSACAREIAAELRQSHAHRNVEVIIQPDLTTQADPTLVRIALDNLLDNAWKFTQNTAQPRIEFGRCHYNEQTWFFVRDNGAGFDKIGRAHV